jgi:putative OPT family oligopeptide transporter
MPARAPETVAEFTTKAVVAGVALGVLFGAANAYIGLRVGMTITASIPAAVMTVVAFRALRVRSTILEANLSQTIGSASTSLATGTIFTIPALFLWGLAPPYVQVVALCFLGGLLGISAMIPLRRLLVVQAHQELPYPEGTACAEVLRATQEGAGAGQGAWIFRGMAVGAGVKLAVSALFLVPSGFAVLVPGLPKAEIALELAPALLAVGFILGYRQSGILVAGSIVSALALTPLIAWLGARLGEPLFPETAKLVSAMSPGEIWRTYVRYIGAGAVATAGILTVARNLPTMVGAFRAVARGLRAQAGGAIAAAPERTDRDLPGGFVLGGVLAVVAVAALVPGVFGGQLTSAQRAICAAGVGLFGVLFVAVAARIVGIVGVSSQPTSGITLVTLLGVASVFAAQGWTDPLARAAVLAVGTIVAIAASKAGDISQDLKTGYLVGATPAKQQFGQLIGAAVACWAVAGVVLLLGATYEFGSQEIPAPQAMLMKTIIEGVLAGNLPWGLVGSGAGIALAAILCGVNGLAFAIGVYLPLSSMLAIYVGGCVRGLVERSRRPDPEARGRAPVSADHRAPVSSNHRAPISSDHGGAGGAARAPERTESDPGVLAASGFVAGEGLAGVAIALLAWQQVIPKSKASLLGGAPGEVALLATTALLCWFLWRAARSARPA